MTDSIPKIVHYCWFGGKSKSASVLRFIRSWGEMLPDYKIIEWNESNFDINSYEYTQQAHACGRFAFVSDVARLHALYTYGGIYLDTDVEIRRCFDDLIMDDVVLGFEEGNYIATSTIISPPAAKLIYDFLESYKCRKFLRDDGSEDRTTNVEKLTLMLESCGLKRDGSNQILSWKGDSIRIFDRVKFSPLDYPNGIDYADQTTYAIHHFGHSWGNPISRAKAYLRKLLIRTIGGGRMKRIREIVSSKNINR